MPMRASMGAFEEDEEDLADEDDRGDDEQRVEQTVERAGARGWTFAGALLARQGVTWARPSFASTSRSAASSAALPGSMWLAITSWSLACRRSPLRISSSARRANGRAAGDWTESSSEAAPEGPRLGGRERGEKRDARRVGAATMCELLVVLRAQARVEQDGVGLRASLEDGGQGAHLRRVAVRGARRGGTCRRRRGRPAGSRRASPRARGRRGRSTSARRAPRAMRRLGRPCIRASRQFRRTVACARLHGGDALRPGDAHELQRRARLAAGAESVAATSSVPLSSTSKRTWMVTSPRGAARSPESSTWPR